MRLDPGLPEAFGDDECKLEGLGGIQSRVAVSVVTRAQVIKGDGVRTTNAFSHILASHFQVNTSRVASFLLMHVEKCFHFSLRLFWNSVSSVMENFQ